MKMVSIIVPVYNAENHLKSCIESILQQSYSSIEVILVDDGSKDNSLKICYEFADKDNRIIVIHKENGGVSSARNVGIHVAKGEYIQFVDSDDWISINYTKKLVEGIEKNNSELVIGGMIFVKGKTEEIHPLKECEIVSKDMWKKQFGFLYKEYYLNSVWNKLFLKEKIESVFREDISLGEDCCFVLEYLRNISRIQLIEDVGYYYQMESLGSLTKQYNMGEFKNAKLLYEETKKYVLESFGEFIGEEDISYIFLQDIRRLLVQINQQKKWKLKQKVEYLEQFASDRIFLGMGNQIAKLGINQKILFRLLKRKHFCVLLIMMKIVWRN